MTAGNDLARIVDTEFTKAGIREYGLPAADHWERAAVRISARCCDVIVCCHLDFF